MSTIAPPVASTAPCSRSCRTAGASSLDKLFLCGLTGVGKSWLDPVLGHTACRDNHPVLYQRAPKLFVAASPASAS